MSSSTNGPPSDSPLTSIIRDDVRRLALTVRRNHEPGSDAWDLATGVLLLPALASTDMTPEEPDPQPADPTDPNQPNPNQPQ